MDFMTKRGIFGIISELLKDATSTERSVILQWINEVLTSEEPGRKLSVTEVHGLVALLHKGGSSKDRTENYRPVVLLNRLFQLVSYIIQERLVRRILISSRQFTRWQRSA